MAMVRGCNSHHGTGTKDKMRESEVCLFFTQESVQRLAYKIIYKYLEIKKKHEGFHKWWIPKNWLVYFMEHPIL